MLAAALIFVFAGISSGPYAPILAEFAPVPNSPSESDAAHTPAPVTETPVTAPREEIGGPQGPEPTRFGDWERNGRCIDF
jgi:hypothetical protein